MNARPRGLAVFDLDRTLLRGPTVCEVLAEPLGRGARMREIEDLRDRAAIASARDEMARWYAGLATSTLLEYLRATQLAPGAASGVAKLRAHGIDVGVASITWKFAVDRIAAELGIEHTLGTALHPDGVIEHVWAEQKAEWLASLAAKLGLERDRVAAIGDSVGDHHMLSRAGHAILVGAHAPPRPDWLHWPAASIDAVAQHLIEVWNV